MDIEKLIEQLNDFNENHISDLCGSGQCACGYLCDKDDCIVVRAATALSTLQAENEKLRNEVERQRRSADDRKHLYENAERAYMKVVAELEQVKREKDAAVADLKKWKICSTCKNYQPHGKSTNCKIKSAYLPGGNWAGCSKWEWRGQKKD